MYKVKTLSSPVQVYFVTWNVPICTRSYVRIFVDKNNVHKAGDLAVEWKNVPVCMGSTHYMKKIDVGVQCAPDGMR